MVVAMDAMAVAIHIKYLVGQNEHLTFYLQSLHNRLCCMEFTV